MHDGSDDLFASYGKKGKLFLWRVISLDWVVQWVGVDAMLGILSFKDVKDKRVVKWIQVVDSFGRISIIFRLEWHYIKVYKAFYC